MGNGTDDTEGKRGRGRPRKTVQVASDAVKQSVEQQIANRISAYSDDFDLTTLTTVDKQNIRNLASLEIAAEAINQQLASHATGDIPLTPAEVKALADSVKVFMAEGRLQATALGIDRKTRMSGEQTELELYLPKMADEAKKFLYQHTVSIVCLECRKSTAQVDIRTGILLYHLFEEDTDWSATFRCQRDSCGKLFTIDHTNWREYRMSAVDAIQADLSDEDKEDEQ